MTPQLYRYQETGAAFLAARSQAFLADDMGLGKSAQAIVAADLVGACRVLVLCPAVARINWAREFDLFSLGTRTTVVLDSGKTPYKPAPYQVVVVSYDVAVRRDDLAKAQWDLLIVDEAHFLKNRDAKRTKAVYGWGKRMAGLISRSARCWRLSGTPMPANPTELWTHVRSAGLTDLSFWDWQARYCAGWDNGFGFQITGAKNVGHLKKTLEPFMLRRKPGDPEVEVELPALTYSNVVVPATKVELKEKFLQDAIIRFGAADPIGMLKDHLRSQEAVLAASMSSARAETSAKAGDDQVVTLLTSLSTGASMLRRYIGVAKAPAVAKQIADELESGAMEKVVIFAWHSEVIQQLTEVLLPYNPVIIEGSTPDKRRQQNIDAFQKDPKTRVFIGQITACGTAITLTASHHVVFAEQSWTPSDNAQALKRCHRIGQKEHVYVRSFALANSIDERVNEVLTRKTRTIFSVMG